MDQQQKEFETIIQKNRRRFAGTVFIVAALFIALLLVYYIKNKNKDRINHPEIIWNVKKNQQNIDNNVYTFSNLNSAINLINSLNNKITQDNKLIKSNNDPLYKIFRNLLYSKNVKNLSITQEVENLISKSSDTLKNNNSNNIVSSSKINEQNNKSKVTPNISVKNNDYNDNITNLIKKENNTKENNTKILSSRRLTAKEILNGKVKDNKYINNNKQFFIQTGAFFDKSKALLQIELLKKHGIPSVLSVINTNSGNLHRVRIGPFKIRFQAKEILDKIKSIDMDGIIVSN